MIKEHRIIREARRLAAENPDFVYKTLTVLDVDGVRREGDFCKYVHDGRGSCLLGQAMMNTGDITADNIEFEDKSISRVFAMLHLRVPDSQQRWAERVQDDQDASIPWGLAVANADAETEIAPCSAT